MAKHCGSGGQCVWWGEKYMKECVCGVRDYLSVGFGLISLLSWAVAEVPQIITNFKNGSTEGVSLGFLMTWVVGDIFNLIGCWLEPATLATQFYTALLYTITTIILVCQIIYYDHFSNWWKVRKAKIQTKQISKCEQNDYKGAREHKKPNTGKDLYYTSARSLASSYTPTPGSYLLHSRGSCKSGTNYMLDESSEEEGELFTRLISPSSKNSNTIIRSVASTIFFVGGLNFLKLPTYKSIFSTSYPVQIERRSVFRITGRKLLQGMGGVAFSRSVMQGDSSSQLGTWLGWIMAAIYMGGRLPQIHLNIKRGTVEGLNPLMFIFALIGNTTYVGSIILRTLEWEKLEPNMPWLVDAAACVLLDFFILVQFIYYKVQRIDEDEDENEDYKVIKD
ncbi:hypothetical protein SUGI_0467750 [Cryptomeria japonica]|nr:hypothetical protein SUGI_0467750 [Cryptomeria japonica]